MGVSKKIFKTSTFDTIGERARPKISVSFNSPIFLLSKIGSYFTLVKVIKVRKFHPLPFTTFARVLK